MHYESSFSASFPGPFMKKKKRTLTNECMCTTIPYIHASTSPHSVTISIPTSKLLHQHYCVSTAQWNEMLFFHDKKFNRTISENVWNKLHCTYSVYYNHYNLHIIICFNTIFHYPWFKLCNHVHYNFAIPIWLRGLIYSVCLSWIFK